MTGWLIVLCAGLALLLCWAVFAFNRLVRLRNQVRTAWADVDAVSYTHLDVYKRQIRRGACICTNRECGGIVARRVRTVTLRIRAQINGHRCAAGSTCIGQGLSLIHI